MQGNYYSDTQSNTDNGWNWGYEFVPGGYSGHSAAVGGYPMRYGDNGGMSYHSMPGNYWEMRGASKMASPQGWAYAPIMDPEMASKGSTGYTVRFVPKFQ